MSIFDYIFVSIFWLLVLFLAYKDFKAIRDQHRIMFAVYSFLILLLLWVGLFIGVTPGSRDYADYRMTRDLFGTSITLGQPEIEYHSERAFNGDGYSIEVYKLNKGEINKIPDAQQKIQSLPTRPSSRSHWQQTFWRQTPIKAEEEHLLEFALMGDASDEGVEKGRTLLNELAHKPGHYYSYFYFMHGQYPGDIDFFLFSPSKNLLILVNLNT